MIVPALLLAMMAPAAWGQDSTATARPPTPAPQRPDSSATRTPAPAPPRADSIATHAPAPAPQRADSTLKPVPLPAPIPPAAPATPPAAPLDSVPEGRVLLYLFNGSGRSLVGGKIGVKCDGKKIAELPRTSYSVVAVDPGKLKLQTTSGGGKLDLVAESGHRYFILAAYWPEKSWAKTPEDHPLLFEPIEEARARELMPKAKRNEAPAK
jgi:hypothetical protein